MALDPLHYRRVMSQFATGVTVVTTRIGRDVHGLTVNAFCSVSCDPPLLLVCIHNEAYSREVIQKSRCFAVNILSQEQEEVARRFSTSSLTAAQRLADLEHQPVVTGAPVFKEVVGWLDCKLIASYPGGDHTIFLGEVLATGHRDDRDPLVFFRSQYQPSDKETLLTAPR